jgi:hypothetical protein
VADKVEDEVTDKVEDEVEDRADKVGEVADWSNARCRFKRDGLKC